MNWHHNFHVFMEVYIIWFNLIWYTAPRSRSTSEPNPEPLCSRTRPDNESRTGSIGGIVPPGKGQVPIGSGRPGAEQSTAMLGAESAICRCSSFDGTGNMISVMSLHIGHNVISCTRVLSVISFWCMNSVFCLLLCSI